MVPGIVRWLTRQSRQDEPLGDGKKIYTDTIDVESVDGQEILEAEVSVVTVAAKGTWASILGGSSGKRRWREGRGRVSVKLWLNGALSPADFINPKAVPLMGRPYVEDRLQPLSQCKYETCLPYGLYSILIHELTHTAEVYYQKALQYKRDSDKEKYVNDPHEVRAFIQQIVDEVIRYGHKIRSHAKSNKKLVDYVLGLSTTWGGIEADLNPRNRAKILKAVYTALEDEGLLE